MDQLQLAHLCDLAGATATYANFRKLPDDTTYIRPRVQDTLLLLKSILELIGLNEAIDINSPITPIIVDCKKVLSRVQNLTYEIKAASGEVPNPFQKSLKECVYKMNDALENIQDCSNVLLLVLHTGLRSQIAINKAKVVKVELDELANDLLSAASRMFQPIEQPENGSEGFTVEEIQSNATDTCRLVCPRAHIFKASKEIRTKVKFRCLCHGAPHESRLSYKVYRGKSLLREEIGLDGPRRWSIVLWRSNKSVIVRLVKVPPSYIYCVQHLADEFGVAYVTNKGDSAFKTDIESRRFECFENDWMFSSAKVSAVKSESAGVERTLATPSEVTLKHYSVVPSLDTNLSLNQLIAGRPRPEPHVHVTLESSSEVLVSTETEICLGRLSVTLAKVVLVKGTGGDKDGEECDVHFGFENRDATESFARYITVAQETLFERLMRGLYYDENIIYCRISQVSWIHGAQRLIRLMILSRGLEGSTHARRAILHQQGGSRYICLDLRSKTSDAVQRGSLEGLNDSTAWVYDCDSTGKPCVSRTNWEALTRPKMATSNAPAVFLNRSQERPVEEWQEEVDDLVRVMKGDRNDPYERVKIAIIDSGLNDRVKSRYMTQNSIVFKDFTKSTRNDSWHGTCCAKIICDIYEEARLYIARIFEDEYVDEQQGPLRMAQAIEWAISAPNRVDIINISAGFREHSEELEAAVTKAKASGVLVVAAAANWANLGVAYPARHHLTTMCIYSTNTGNQGSTFNPEPRGKTNEFAVLGEGFKHPDPLRGTDERISGTSMATAAAVGIAATIIDFSRQRDNKPVICRSQHIGKLPGMLSVFDDMSKSAGSLRYVAPLSLLPEDRGLDKERGRRRARELLSKAMENSN